MVMAAGIAIFIVTLGVIVVRPRGISEAVPAMLGGLAMLPLGLLTIDDALGTLAANATLFLFFLGLMTIAAVSDDAGFFERVARLAVMLSRGSPRRLLVNLFIAGAGITAILSNDATALVLTPVVYVLVVRLRLEPAPYVFACTFVADAASFLLPVSNPVNVIVLSHSGIGLGAFLLHLFPVALVVLSVNLGLFLVLFRGDLRGAIDIQRLTPQETTSRYLRWVIGLLGVIATGYVAASATGAPVAYVAGAGGAVLLLASALAGRFQPRTFARAISWPLFPFIAGMLLLVRGMENLGLITLLSRALVSAAGGTVGGATLAGSIGVAVGANLINNVPMALLTERAIAALPPDLAIHTPLLYAAVLGADLGPNISVAGSLATMLWLLILRQRGLQISSIQYLKLGVIITPPALIAGALTLWTIVRIFP